MTNPKVPTPIVDKNGKQTTVHRSAEKPANGKTRGIPSPVTHGTEKKSPLKKLLGAVKRSDLSDDTGKLSKLVRHLGRAEGGSPADRYNGFVKLLSATYDIDKHKAKVAADRIYTALGLRDSIKETVHRDVMQKAASAKLRENHKTRFPREGTTPEAVPSAPTAEPESSTGIEPNHSIGYIAENNPELIEAVSAITSIDAEGKSTLVLVNAILNAEDKPRLEAVKSALESHGIDAPVKDFYTIYSLATREGLSTAARTRAFQIILTENPDAVATLDGKLASL